eukprot:gene2042-3970_t
MSIFVVYDGKRQMIKIGPTTSIRQIISDACTILKLNESRLALKHKRTTLDPSSPFQFTGIPLNSTLDLIRNDIHHSSKPVRVALSTHGYPSMTGSFDPDSILLNILEYFVSENQLSNDIFNRSPEIIFLRQSFSGDSLQTTTLGSLGLSGQSARFQLRCSDAVSGSNSPPSNIDTEVLTSDQIPMDVSVFTAICNDTTFENGQGNDEAVSLSTKSVDNTSEVEMHVDDNSNETDQPIDKTYGSYSDRNLPFPFPKNLSKELVDTLLALLSSDPESHDKLLICLPILFRYISNVIEFPGEDRYRSIRTSNTTFQQKVACIHGAVELLVCAGFTRSDSDLDSRETTTTITATTTSTTLTELRLRPEQEDNGQRARFVALKAVLEAAAKQLDISLIRAPPAPVSGNSNSNNSVCEGGDNGSGIGSVRVPVNTSSSSSSSFDPYKTFIVRTNPQPRGGTSITESRLQQLLQRKNEMLSAIEQKGQEIISNRETRLVSFPSSGSSLSSSTLAGQDKEDEEEEVEDRRGDGGLLLQAMARKKAVVVPDEGPPLTTRAMRELSFLEKEKVYETVVVRISFPDRVVVQGRFLPTETLQDVRLWLETHCLCEGWSQRSFELTCSGKPSTAAAVAGNTSSHPNAGQPSLQEMGLVPATLLRLRWTGDLGLGLVSMSPPSSDNNIAVSVSIGSYLRDDLLLSADIKSKEDRSYTGAKTQTLLYPEGKSLSLSLSSNKRSSTEDSSSPVTGVNNAESASATTANSEPKKSGGKPKWFKL